MMLTSNRFSHWNMLFGVLLTSLSILLLNVRSLIMFFLFNVFFIALLFLSQNNDISLSILSRFEHAPIQILQVNVHLNYPKFIFTWTTRSSSSPELPESHLYLNYPNFIFTWTTRSSKFHFNFRHSDFHLNYSTTAFDLLFRKSSVKYRVLETSVR